MKKMIILAVSAILALNISAQEANAHKAECKKDKKECQFNAEQRIEQDIKILSEELFLSPEQEAQFAVTYREFVAAKIKLNKEFAAKFAKDLNDRQVRAVLHFKGGCRKGDFHKGKEGGPEQGKIHRGDRQKRKKAQD